MLTSRIQGFRFSSSMMSKPNSSWQLWGVFTCIFSRVFTYGSELRSKQKWGNLFDSGIILAFHTNKVFGLWTSLGQLLWLWLMKPKWCRNNALCRTWTPFLVQGVKQFYRSELRTGWGSLKTVFRYSCVQNNGNVLKKNIFGWFFMSLFILLHLEQKVFSFSAFFVFSLYQL